MPVNVCEKFLEQAEQSDLRVFRQAPETGFDAEFHFDTTAFGESGGKGSKRGTKAGFVQQERMEKVRNGTNLLDHFFGEIAGRLQKLVSDNIFLGERLSYTCERHLQRRHTLRNGFVQRDGHAALLFVAQGKQLIGDAA